MYEKFYGLKRNPFGLSPDPRFYYPTTAHNEALANLSYGIAKRKGFIVLTGEVGTGKTLLIRYLIEALVKTKVQYAYVFNPRLSASDFLQYILADFGIKDPGKNQGEMLLRFSQFLIDLHRRGSTAALLVDEAHQLSVELLEELRLLTNIETSQQKLLQIVLVGQPELDQTLDSIELRQLKQRIALRCRLQPLDASEIRGYIVRRLQLAGAAERSEQIFPEPALQCVARHSRGIPRLINTLCDNALVNAYSRRNTLIEPADIEEVAADLRLDVPLEPQTGLHPDDEKERTAMIRALLRMAQMLDSRETRSQQESQKTREGTGTPA